MRRTRAVFLLCLLVSAGFLSCRSEEASTAAAPENETANNSISSADSTRGQLWDSTQKNLPSYLLVKKEIYDRDSSGEIIDAPQADARLAQSYPWWINKGPVIDQARFTIMCAKLHYRKNEKIRVVHVMEEQKKGRTVYVMGPKEIKGEYINDSLVTEAPPANSQPWVPLVYDGLVDKGPAVDYHFEISTYSFAKPGLYKIQWRMGKYVSNTLSITVE